LSSWKEGIRLIEEIVVTFDQIADPKNVSHYLIVSALNGIL